MKPRERVIKAIEHQEPDRVPIGFGHGLSYEVGEKLLNHFGIKDTKALMKKLGIDTIPIIMDPPHGYKPTNPSTLYMEGSIGYLESAETVLWDEWGIGRVAAADGHYSHFTRHPLQAAESVDEIKNFEFPDLDLPGRFDRPQMIVKEYKDEYAVCAVLEMTLFEQAWQLRGYTKFIEDLYLRPDFVNTLLDRLLEHRIRAGKRYLDLGIDIMRLGDDFGTQVGMIVSPNIWRKYFKPRMKHLINELRQTRPIYIFYHSDGNIEPIIPELIEIGVDILNPVQPDCMNTETLKKLYGEKLTFYGGISVQETLPLGTVQDVKKEAITRMRSMGHGGGYILSPSHVVGYETPLQNALALYETANQYGQYPLE
jgi:uroporphyrinogen decarboxylase